MFRRGDESDSDDSDVVEFTRRKGPAKPKPVKQDDDDNSKEAADDETELDGEGGLFGNLLTLADEQAASGVNEDENSTVRYREFPLPKHLPSAFTLPKKLLADLTLGGAKNVVSDPLGPRSVTNIEYKNISKGSRLKRVALTIEYVPTALMQKKDIGKSGKDKKQNGKGSAPKAKGTGGQNGPEAANAPAPVPVTPNAVPPKEPLTNTLGPSQLSTNPNEAPPKDPGPPPPPPFSHKSDPSVLSLTMHDIGTPTQSEAENYLALIAVHELTTGLPHSRLYSPSLGLRPENYTVHPDPLGVKHELPLYSPINPRLLPVPYRDLWEELEAIKKSRQDALDRLVWKDLDGVLRSAQIEADSKIASGGKGSKLTTTLTDGELAEGPQDEEHKSGVRSQKRPLDYFDQRILNEWNARYQSKKYRSMAVQRETLPIASYRQTIIDTLNSNQVLVLSGETGCGKSTQLPSFIVENNLAQGKNVKVVVCEPRRISAISLANRVSEELGEPRPPSAKNDGGLIGYQVRLESTVGKNTRLSFVTYGIALRMLEQSSDSAAGAFDDVTHIIVDEVHERSIDSDFLLIVLKSLMIRRPELKVVLMSATLESAKISNYFDRCPVLEVPGRTFPVNHKYIEEIVEYSGYALEKSKSQLNLNNDKLQFIEDNDIEEIDGDNEDPAKTAEREKQKKGWSAQTLEIVSQLNPRQIPYNLIVKLIEKLDADTREGSLAILVFLPGMREIKQLMEMCDDHRVLGNRKLWNVFPLHSSIDSSAQQAVFAVSPTGRKLVLSTNIAETGVTIPDINCVIDVGKHREMRYDEKRGISRLMETWVAQSNAKQRAGRAGRVQEGTCYHLYTEERHTQQVGWNHAFVLSFWRSCTDNPFRFPRWLLIPFLRSCGFPSKTSHCDVNFSELISATASQTFFPKPSTLPRWSTSDGQCNLSLMSVPSTLKKTFYLSEST